MTHVEVSIMKFLRHPHFCQWILLCLDVSVGCSSAYLICGAWSRRKSQDMDLWAVLHTKDSKTFAEQELGLLSYVCTDHQLEIIRCVTGRINTLNP